MEIWHKTNESPFGKNKSGKGLIAFIFSFMTFLASCSNNGPAINRNNPTPVPAATASASELPKFTSLPPVPEESIIPTPPPVRLSDFTFDVEIQFDAILGRVYVDDGEIMDTPAKYTLVGGQHTIIVFDLVTLCRIARIYIIDKNQTIRYTLEHDC
jgi:hypothetical protein